MICFRLVVALWITGCVLPFAARGQNLVINGNFDDPNICKEYEAKCAPSAWFYVYATGPGWGYKPRINNSPYAIQLFSAQKKDNTRSFWQTMLARPVIPKQEYLIEVDVSADEGRPDLNDIGIVLSPKMYFAVYSDYKLPEKYISLTDAKVTKLGNGWYHLSKICSFTDTMQVLVIGNFSQKSNAQILKERKNKNGYIVTNIDNLSLVPVTPPGSKILADSPIPTPGLKDSLYNIRERHRGVYELANQNAIMVIENVKTQKKISTRTDTLVIPDIAFAFDSYQLVDRPLLVRQLQPVINGRISKILVEGFTDSKGSTGYNDTLSTQRAAAVAALLITEFPLVKYLTESRGAGISRKYNDDNKNRRVEIIIYKLQE
jgi:outer membrane protein OmpA-like peptidoglycan-associated protein